MKRLFVLFAALVFALALCGCSKEGIYRVELEGSASTGYVWTYEMENDGIVEEVYSAYEGAQIMGAAGVRGNYVFEFKGVAAGEVEIEFEYHTDWSREPDAEAIRTKTVELSVAEDGTITELSADEEITPEEWLGAE